MPRLISHYSFEKSPFDHYYSYLLPPKPARAVFLPHACFRRHCSSTLCIAHTSPQQVLSRTINTGQGKETARPSLRFPLYHSSSWAWRDHLRLVGVRSINTRHTSRIICDKESTEDRSLHTHLSGQAASRSSRSFRALCLIILTAQP